MSRDGREAGGLSYMREQIVGHDWKYKCLDGCVVGFQWMNAGIVDFPKGEFWQMEILRRSLDYFWFRFG